MFTSWLNIQITVFIFVYVECVCGVCVYNCDVCVMCVVCVMENKFQVDPMNSNSVM